MLLDVGRGSARLDLAGLIDCPDPQPPAAAVAAGGIVQPGHREPAHHAHRGEGVPDGAVEQSLSPLRGAVSCRLGDRPPVAFRDVAGDRGDVLARLQPRLHPHEAPPQQP
jgi:hypothetical protein